MGQVRDVGVGFADEPRQARQVRVSELVAVVEPFLQGRIGPGGSISAGINLLYTSAIVVMVTIWPDMAAGASFKC
jgi:hypothetical protein